MKVTVIGSSTNWTERPRSSYCINNSILVDCGEGVTKHYKKCGVNFDAIKHIFLTHIHTDHMMGVLSHIYIAIINKQPKENQLTIYGPKGIFEVIYFCVNKLIHKNLDEKEIRECFNVVEIEDFSKIIQVEDMKISCHKLVHLNIENIAYIFDDGKTKVGFSGDTRYDQELEKFVREFDVGFVECCAENSTQAHIGYDKFKQLEQKYPQKTFYAIHCNEEIFKNAKKLKINCVNTKDVFQF